MKKLLAMLLLWPLAPVAAELPEGAVRLNTAQIQQAFAGMRDEAQVQDSAGATAVNHWYADGRFHNRWRKGEHGGEVVGRWWAQDDRRCVLVHAGLPGRDGEPECVPVFRQGDRYFSLNAQGHLHGIHRLSPLPPEAGLENGAIGE